MWFSSRKTRWNTRVRSFRRTLPLRLETLEDRTVPSTFTVLNTLDNGTGSLRQAILDANANLGADVIHFAPGVTGTITLTSGELDIIDDVDLQGPGSGVVTVSGNNASLVFRVSAKATISGLTITRGSSSNGGGIYNTGTLTVENSTFDGNTGATVYNPGFAVVAPYYSQVGSGIYNDNGGMATVSGSTFSNNTGSGIYNYSVGSTTTVIVSDSTFSGNQAGEGGGIFSLGATLTVSNSTFSGNSASGVPKNSGGGINCSIGGTLTVSNSTFSDNQAGYGGGISVSFGVTATVNKSTFSGNRAFVAAGGIFNFQATLTVTNSIIAGNTSPLGPDIWGPVTSNGYNLIGDASASSGFGALDMVGLYVVVGTAGVDSLTVAPGSQAGTLKTTVNGVVTDNIAFSGIVLVEGLGGNDTITITASLAGGVVVDGGDGSDTYNISFGNLAGPVTVADRGPSTDTNTLNATGSPDSNTANYIVKTTGKITWGPSSTPTETVTYSGIQPVNIYGGAGTNVITDPGGQTTITGGPRQNTITITATSGNGVVLNGGTSTSTNNYFINMGNLLGPVTVNSTTGTCTVTINGPSGSNVLILTSSQLTGDGETINFNLGSTAKNIAVAGGGSNNNQLVVQGTPPGPVTAQNLAPTVGAITAPLAPNAVNTAISVSANFTNLDGNSQTAVWNWGDNTTSSGSVTQTGTTGAVTGSHSYATDGVFTITLTMKDPSGAGPGTSLFQYEVIYNPSGGFVTGGGWITSLAGAYVPNPALTGKTSIGIDVKYNAGSSAPTGNTDFQLPAASLHFQSTSYAWLTISGTMAQYQGTGTINGAGSYGFIATVTEGDLLGGTARDTFRIRIWDATKSNGSTSAGLIYDNYASAAIYNDPSGTALGGGNITIHKSNQTAAGGPGPNSAFGPVLTADQLQAIVAAAIARWQEAGATPAQLSPLAHLTYQIVSLPPGILAMTGPGIIWVSPNADGYGWYVDSSPASNSAFVSMASSPAHNHMDLLSVMAHELGHIILNVDESSQPNDVMTEALPQDVRRLPTPYDLGLQPSAAWASSNTSIGLKAPVPPVAEWSVSLLDRLFAGRRESPESSGVSQGLQLPPATLSPLVVPLTTRKAEDFLPNRAHGVTSNQVHQGAVDEEIGSWRNDPLDAALVDQLVHASGH